MSKFKGKVVILNSPPNSGKDSIAEVLNDSLDWDWNCFKDHLYDCTATLFNTDKWDLIEWATDRVTKEVPLEELSIPSDKYKLLDNIVKSNRAFTLEDGYIPLSPREALIYTSEVVIKPTMGEEYFGKIAAENIDLDAVTVFSDGGFNEELLPVIERVGAENVYVVQWSREGCSFKGDSRNYLKVPNNVNLLVTKNDGTIDDLADEVINWISGE